MAGGGGELTTALLNVVEEDELGMKQKVWIESKKLWVVAAPAIFTRFSTFGVSMISQAFIGHLGPTELAAYSITFTILLRFSNGILLSHRIFLHLQSLAAILCSDLRWEYAVFLPPQPTSFSLIATVTAAVKSTTTTAVNLVLEGKLQRKYAPASCGRKLRLW